MNPMAMGYNYMGMDNSMLAMGAVPAITAPVTPVPVVANTLTPNPTLPPSIPSTSPTPSASPVPSTSTASIPTLPSSSSSTTTTTTTVAPPPPPPPLPSPPPAPPAFPTTSLPSISTPLPSLAPVHVPPAPSPVPPPPPPSNPPLPPLSLSSNISPPALPTPSIPVSAPTPHINPPVSPANTSASNTDDNSAIHNNLIQGITHLAKDLLSSFDTHAFDPEILSNIISIANYDPLNPNQPPSISPTKPLSPIPSPSLSSMAPTFTPAPNENSLSIPPPPSSSKKYYSKNPPPPIITDYGHDEMDERDFMETNNYHDDLGGDHTFYQYPHSQHSSQRSSKHSSQKHSQHHSRHSYQQHSQHHSRNSQHSKHPQQHSSQPQVSQHSQHSQHHSDLSDNYVPYMEGPPPSYGKRNMQTSAPHPVNNYPEYHNFDNNFQPSEAFYYTDPSNSEDTYYAEFYASMINNFFILW